MYLARISNRGRTRYVIRQSYADGSRMKSRDLFDLGSDPARHIVYLGGKGYTYTDELQDALSASGVKDHQDQLDKVLFDFLDPEIQRVIIGFDRSRRRSGNKAISHRNDETEGLHIFDKRRYHFLRFGAGDQRNIHRVPEKVFSLLHEKSRDELEQYFIGEERMLRHREKPVYVTTIFQLKRFAFSADSALSLQEQMDEFFLHQLCRLNEDGGFWSGMEDCDRLRDYLIRYVTFYFDFEPPRPSPWQAYMEDFINRHRTYRQPKKVQIKLEEAARLFGMPWKDLKKLDGKSLTRLYRKLAMKHHPDLGGSAETFCRLTDYYRVLLKRR